MSDDQQRRKGKTTADMPEKTESNNNEGMTKRLIVSCSNKGGVGKSFFLIQLIEWLNEHPSNPTFAAFDPDSANRTLLTYHKESTTFVDVDKVSSLDVVGAALENVDISILDGLGSQQKKTILAWMDEVGLFELADELGFRITFVAMIEEDRDVILQTKELLAVVGKKVDWVFVVNKKNAKDGLLWEGSAVRKTGLNELGGIEIVLERVTDPMQMYLSKEILPISVADSGPRVNVYDRNRFRNLWKRISAEITKAEKYFLPVA